MSRQISLGFGEALDAIKGGKLMRRRGWNGKGMYVYLARPEGLPTPYLPSSPYLAFRPADGVLVPWVASQTDLLATDWEEVAP